MHHATCDREDLAEQFIEVGDRIDEAAHLDEPLVNAQRFLEGRCFVIHFLDAIFAREKIEDEDSTGNPGGTDETLRL